MNMSEEKVVRTACADCHVGCGVLAHVKDGRIVKLEGNPDHPTNRGMMCPKGLAAKQHVYHPDRLTYPMKRAGQREEGKWQRISWDEALDTIAAKFMEIKEQYGPYAIACQHGGKPSKVMRADYALMHSIGSPNLGNSDAPFCYGPMPIAEGFTYGGMISQEYGSDCENSNLAIVWGGTPASTHLPWARLLSLAVENRGTKVIVVDPRFTVNASKADLWLQPRPGTDAALALGMLNIIINEELYDKEFVNKWCIGFEELRQRVQEYPLEKVAEITWVAKDDIIKAARLYATIKPATLYQRASIEMQMNSVQTLRALAILRAVTGNIDIEGGNVFCCFPEGYVHQHAMLGKDSKVYSEGRLSDEIEEKRLGAKEYPLLSGPRAPFAAPVYPPALIKAILTDKPYPIKALWVSNNLLLCLPNSREVYRALKKVPFLVVREFFMTPTAEMADIVLPVAHWLEMDEIFSQTTNIITARQKIIEPVGECWDEMKVSFELLKRMGLKYFATPAQNAEEELDYLVKGMGMTFEEFKRKHVIVAPMEYKKYEKSGFKTPSGKVELSSSVFKEFGYDPLPYYSEPLESPVSTPELAKEYPFILIAGRRRIAYMHSMGRGIPWLRELVPDPQIEIHPQSASELGIKDGDWVWIELSPPNEKGRIKNRAKLTRGIQPQVAQCDAHWWFPEKPGPDHGHWEVNVNALINGSGRGDPIAGTILLTGLLCKIYKDEES